MKLGDLFESGSFTTELGSTYIVNGSKTKRTKSYHKGHLPTDIGEKPESNLTIYVNHELAKEIGMWNTSSASGKRIVLQGSKLILISKNPLTNNYGKDVIYADNTFTTTPEIGKSPLELFDPNEQGWFRGNHPGNKITHLSNFT